MIIEFNDKYRSCDMGLKMTGFYIPMPSPKTNLIDIPGGDGSVDLSEVSGRIRYSDRSGVNFTFDFIDGSYDKWLYTYSKLSELLHGKKAKVRVSADPHWYYMMRLTLDSNKTNPFLSQFTLSGTADPFKYAQKETVVKKELEDETVVLEGFGIGSVPEFIVSDSNMLKLVREEKEYSLVDGYNRFADLVINEKEELTFSGSGNVTIHYRGRCL